jgi:hypothetical protein
VVVLLIVGGGVVPALPVVPELEPLEPLLLPPPQAARAALAASASRQSGKPPVRADWGWVICLSPLCRQVRLRGLQAFVFLIYQHRRNNC